MNVRWRALILLTAARTTMGVQFQSLASVFSGIAGEIALNFSDLGLLVGLYFLPGVVVALPAAAAGQRYGDKRMVLAGLFLMALGGVLLAAADSAASLAAGRVVSGIGAVLLNVLMSKMITDWFAAREITLAMSIFINAFPIGIGLAQLGFGGTWFTLDWRHGMLLVAGLAALAFVVVLCCYTRHANDLGITTASGATRLASPELKLACLAGAIWGLYNGAFAVMFSFAPFALANAGLRPAESATLIALSTWAVVLSVQAGGVVAGKWVAPGLLLIVGIAGWGLCMAVAASMPALAGPALLLSGLVMGWPVGVILAMPAQVLQPAQRSIGMGVFYLWLYAGHGLIPPVAGWLQDRMDAASTSLLVVGGLAVGILLVHHAYVRVLRGYQGSGGERAST